MIKGLKIIKAGKKIRPKIDGKREKEEEKGKEKERWF